MPQRGSGISRNRELVYFAGASIVGLGGETMPGTVAKVCVSEKPLVILEEWRRSRTAARGVVQRALIVVQGFRGCSPSRLRSRRG